MPTPLLPRPTIPNRDPDHEPPRAIASIAPSPVAVAMTPVGLKELYDRQAKVMARRPSFARATSQACVHLSDGLRCDVHDEDRLLTVDEPEPQGGTDCGPHPGQLMRASLGSCLAIGYRLWGARLGTRVDSVDLEIACDFDVRGQLGLSPDISPGWQRVRIHVVIVSPDPEAAVRRVVETADRLSPILANLSPAVEREHRLTVVAPRLSSRPPTAASTTHPTEVR